MIATNRTTYWMATVCVAVLVASVLLPRMFREPGGGFAAATSAALLFMVLGAVAAFASIALLVHTLRQRHVLSPSARIAGAIPAALVSCGLVALWLTIRSNSSQP